VHGKILDTALVLLIFQKIENNTWAMQNVLS
jgi:hypothetical protein